MGENCSARLDNSLTICQDLPMKFTRYGVTASAGQKDGKRMAVWDRHMHRVASWHRTFAQAQKAAWKANREND